MILRLKYVMKYHTAIKWAHGRATGIFLFLKIAQKCSKFPLANDFMAISGSVDSTTSLVDGFYVPNMV